MPRRTRRWSFLLGALLTVAGLALLAKPLVAASPAAPSISASAMPSPADIAPAAANDATCCRNDRRRVEFDPAPALGMLGAGGILMLAAAVAAGAPTSRRLA